MKHKTRKLFSILLALVMVAGLLPLGQVAYAADWGIQISDTDASGAGWAYTVSDHTLKLNNYTGGPVLYVGVPTLTVELTGDNTITADTERPYGIYAYNAGAVVKGDGNLTMNVSYNGTGQVGYGFCTADNGDPAGFVMESGSVNINVTSESMARGIYAVNGVDIKGGTLAINVSGKREPVGVYSRQREIKIGTGTTVDISLTQNGDSNSGYGIFNQAYVSSSTNNGDITLAGNVSIRKSDASTGTGPVFGILTSGDMSNTDGVISVTGGKTEITGVDYGIFSDAPERTGGVADIVFSGGETVIKAKEQGVRSTLNGVEIKNAKVTVESDGSCIILMPASGINKNGLIKISGNAVVSLTSKNGYPLGDDVGLATSTTRDHSISLTSGGKITAKTESSMYKNVPLQGFFTLGANNVLTTGTVASGDDSKNSNGTPYFRGEDGVIVIEYSTVTPPATYTITFNANGGSVTPTSGTTGTDGKLTSLPTPTHTNTNMQFLGWFTAASGGTEVKANDTVFTGNDTIYAHWKDNTPSPSTYTVTVTNDGHGTGAANPTSGTSGSKTTLTATPSGGYKFKEWQVVTANGGTLSSATANPAEFTIGTGNAEIKAIFEQIPASVYTVTFNPNGGSVTPTSGTTGTDGKLMSLPTPTRSGNYSFDGWYTAATGGTKVTVGKTYTADTIIYAHWTYNGGGSGGGGGITTQYTLTYNTNGGSAVASTKHNSGTTVNLTATPTKEGFTFDGWYADAALTSKITSIKMDGNKTVYAGWKETGTSGHDCPSAHLKDIDPNAWYHEYVDYVIENGLMYGIADDRFGPDVTTSRAMIVTILYRLENSPAVSGSSPFDDVAEGLWYTDAVKWAEANEIVEGYSPDKFGPNDLITREQLAAIMYRYSAFKGYDVSKAADLTGYTDASSISDWAVPAMKWAVAEGLIAGRTTTTLVPRGNATRAEAAAILMRYIEKTK